MPTPLASARPPSVASASREEAMGIHTDTRGTDEFCLANEYGTSSTIKSNAPSCREVGDVSQCVQATGREFVLGELPEDIFDHLYSLMPMEDAARAACVSRRFLRSWRHYPSLVFSNKTLGIEKLWQCLKEDTLALKDEQYRNDKIKSHFTNKIDLILENRSGFGMKKFILQLFPCPNIDASYLDKWLQIAVKPGIEELAFEMSILKRTTEYSFPCLLLSDEIGGSTLQSLRLISCAFHPTTTLGCNKSLTSLYLHTVRITGEELGHFVANCIALTQLLVYNCNDIICFKVPSVLHHLNYFSVTQCEKLQVIEINAPKLSSFVCGEDLIHISLGAEVKHISIVGSQPNTICHARTRLPSFMPTVERVTVESHCEKVKTPMMPSKFLCLKYLDISLVDVQLYRQDYFCLVSFLDASPALETFILRVETCSLLRRDSVLRYLNRDQLHLRQILECWHCNLKNVMVTGFSSAKSLIELTRHIVQNASALECMTLDTARGCGKRTAKSDKCRHMTKEGLMEVRKAVEAMRRCIQGIVPSSTNFKVLEPCSQCGCQG